MSHESYFIILIFWERQPNRWNVCVHLGYFTSHVIIFEVYLSEIDVAFKLFNGYLNDLIILILRLFIIDTHMS